jgi:sucrose phosphorylase
MKNQVQLITYVDRLGQGSIRSLQQLLASDFANLFGSVHLLPFYTPIDGADAGFDPSDHTTIDARLGTWADLKALSGDVDVMADVIINHISSDSPQFQHYLRHGDSSEFATMFLHFGDVFPAGATEQHLSKIFRQRPALPFTGYKLANGTERLLWTSFSAQQIDLNVCDPCGKAYLHKIIEVLARNRVKLVRLDAVGYAIKRAGENCFMMPETFAFIAEFAAFAKRLGIKVLVEVHSYFKTQIEIAKHVDWVYDFALPPLLLHAFAFKKTVPLKEWIRIRPNNAINVLDTHDGIGIMDIGPDSQDALALGLVPQSELEQLVEIIHDNCKGQSRLASGAAASNLDIYQVNCTYFDAMARDESRYLLARAIQLFLPGVPQIYYVGLLAGENDMDLLTRTKVGRDINRHYYSLEDLQLAVQKPVVQRLFELIRLRNQHPAFTGAFALEESTDESLSMRWQLADSWISLHVDVSIGSGHICAGHPDSSAVLMSFGD